MLKSVNNTDSIVDFHDLINHKTTIFKSSASWGTDLFIIGVCTDTYVIYQSVLEKRTYELAIHS